MKWLILKLTVAFGKNTCYNFQSFLHNSVFKKTIKIQT